jgi:hypothetical protein
MAIKVHSTKDVTVNGVKMMVYGASGVGKTVLTTTCPNPIIISAEKGLLSLSDFDYPYIEVKTLDSMDAAYKYCRTSEYTTIIIDSISEIATAILAGHKRELIAESKTGKIDARQAYGKLAESVGNLIRNFRDIDGKHVLFIAKERRMVDEDANTFWFEAYLPGQVLPFDTPFLVDEVFSMQIDRKGERFLQTQPDRKRTCKDRSGKLDISEKPHIGRIIDKITGSQAPPMSASTKEKKDG